MFFRHVTHRNKGETINLLSESLRLIECHSPKFDTRGEFHLLSTVFFTYSSCDSFTDSPSPSTNNPNPLLNLRSPHTFRHTYSNHSIFDPTFSDVSLTHSVLKSHGESQTTNSPLSNLRWNVPNHLSSVPEQSSYSRNLHECRLPPFREPFPLALSHFPFLYMYYLL